MLAEEAKTRQTQDASNSGDVARFREETTEEALCRKRNIAGVQGEVKDVLQRLVRERESLMAKEKERWQAIAALRDEATAEAAKRGTTDDELR